MLANVIPAKPNSYLSLTGFGIILIVFFALSYLPYSREYQALTAQINDRKEQISDMAAQSKELKDTNEHVELISQQVKDYDQLVPVTQDLGVFLGQLSNELSAAGLQDSAVQAMPPIILGRCEQLPIQIHGIGTAAQCHDFLKRLEALPRKSSVSHVEFEGDAAMTGKVSMELTLSIYNLKSQ